MEPLRIALLTSEEPVGIDRLLADSNRGSTWDLSIVVGSEPRFVGMEAVERANVPIEIRPARTFKSEQHESFRSLRIREEYDWEIADLLEAMKVDYILLAGYNYLLTEPILTRFPERILAVHDADLSLRLVDPERLYAGPHAVRDALLAGERETRSCVYMVTRDVGRGPLFLLGPSFPVAAMAIDARARGDAEFLLRYAALHRQWMVSASWGPLLARTLELLAGGTIKVVGDLVWIDGAPGPCRMNEAPAMCDESETVQHGIPRSCPFIG